MKFLLVLWLFMLASLYHCISGHENEELSTQNTLTIPNIILNTTNDDVIEARASHRHPKHKILNNILKPSSEYCFNIPKGLSIPEVLNNKNFDRLVVYFYNIKNNDNENFNTKIMYVPGVKKQHMIPDLPVDKEDLILDSGLLQISDIFSAANSYITNSKNNPNLFEDNKGEAEYDNNNEGWNIKKPADNLDKKLENEMISNFDEFLHPFTNEDNKPKAEIDENNNNKEWNVIKPVDNLNENWENEMTNYFDDFLHSPGKDNLAQNEDMADFTTDSENVNIRTNSQTRPQKVFDQLNSWNLNKDTKDELPDITDNLKTKDTKSSVVDQYNTDINDIEKSLGKKVFQKQILLKLLLNNGVTIDKNGNLRDLKGRVNDLNSIYLIPIIEKNKNSKPISYSLNSIAIVLKSNQRIVSIIKIKNKIIIGADKGATKSSILNFPPKRLIVEENPLKSDNLVGSELFPMKHGILNNPHGLTNKGHLNHPKYNHKLKPCRTLACKLEEQAMKGVPVAPRIIGGSAAIASGLPIRNRGRSGLII